MRKLIALAAGIACALTLLPTLSHASATCPGINDNPGNFADPGLGGGGTQPANPLAEQRRPVLYIESGVLLPAEVRALTNGPTGGWSGFRNLGEVGCLGVCQGTVNLCVSDVENGLVATNYLTPGANTLQVIAHNYPSDIDHIPDPGCLRFNGTPSALCNQTGDLRVLWNPAPQLGPLFPDGPRFASKSFFTIPATATYVRVSVSLATRKTFPNEQVFTTTYTKAA